MKITLISPLPDPQDQHAQRTKPLFPPLALMALASLTPADVEVEIIDEAVRMLPDDIDSDLVGITTATATARRAYEIADNCRKKGQPVVLGGIHATVLPSEAGEHADAVVVGEAEGKWQRLLSDFEAGRMQAVYSEKERPRPEEISEPRRDLIDPSDYFFANTVQTTRGCPFNCSFCSVSVFYGRTYRTRPVEAVIGEIEKMPGSRIVFVDDNIIGNPTYARQLFSAMVPLKKQWIGQASLTMLKNPDVMKLAAESGCIGLFVGMETLTDSSLANIGKTINQRKDYENAVNMLHDLGIGILGAFVFGFDEDDDSVFDRTVEFVNRTKLDAAQFSILTPFPGTRIYNELQSQGRIIDTDWMHYDAEHVVFRPAKIKPEKLMDGLVSAYRHIYSSTSMLKRLGIPLSYGRTVVWSINLAYQKRVRSWARWMEGQKDALMSFVHQEKDASACTPESHSL